MSHSPPRSAALLPGQPLRGSSPGAVLAPLGGVQGMAWGGPLPAFQCCWGLGDARTPAAEDVEAAAFQASEAAASARVDSVMRSPSFSVNPSCSLVGAASLPPHPTVCAAFGHRAKPPAGLGLRAPVRRQRRGARARSILALLLRGHSLTINRPRSSKTVRAAPAAPQPLSPAPQLQFPEFPAGKGCAAK